MQLLTKSHSSSQLQSLFISIYPIWSKAPGLPCLPHHSRSMFQEHLSIWPVRWNQLGSPTIPSVWSSTNSYTLKHRKHSNIKHYNNYLSYRNQIPGLEKHVAMQSSHYLCLWSAKLPTTQTCLTTVPGECCHTTPQRRTLSTKSMLAFGQNRLGRICSWSLCTTWISFRPTIINICPEAKHIWKPISYATDKQWQLYRYMFLMFLIRSRWGT